MAYTCWCLLLRCQGQHFRSHLYLIKPYWTVPIHLIMSLLFFWQVFSCYFLLKTYGTLSFFLSPMRTWVVALTLFLVYRIWAMESILLRTFIVDMKNYQTSWCFLFSGAWSIHSLKLLSDKAVNYFQFECLMFWLHRQWIMKVQDCHETPSVLLCNKTFRKKWFASGTAFLLYLHWYWSWHHTVLMLDKIYGLF